MKSMIYGAGSMGTVLGALLADKGEDVVLVSRNKSHIDALNNHGAAITGGINITVPVKAALKEEIDGEYDVIMLMTKQHDNPESAAFLMPFLKKDGVICTSQNGYPEKRLAESVPPEKIVGCTISWSATRTGPGSSELTSGKDTLVFSVGSYVKGNEEAVQKTKALLSKAGKTVADEDLNSLRWSKLLVNCAVSAVSSSVNQLCGAAANDPLLQKIALHTLKEVIDVGKAENAEFRPVAGYDIASLLYLENEDQIEEKQKRMPEIFRSIMNASSSILQDLRANRKTEVDYINGIVCLEGRKHGIPTPYNDRIVEIIHGIENGLMPFNMSNVFSYSQIEQ